MLSGDKYCHQCYLGYAHCGKVPVQCSNIVVNVDDKLPLRLRNYVEVSIKTSGTEYLKSISERLSLLILQPRRKARDWDLLRLIR